MLKAKTYIILICLCASFSFLFAQTSETFPFMGRVKAKDINVRIDSTVSAQVICQVRENDRLEVVSGLYDWYKVRLPRYAPAYVHKGMLELVDAQTAKVAKDRVNIRLLPSESSPIIGKADQGEAVNILEFRRDWYKIQPVRQSFGWINRKFVEKDTSAVVPLLSLAQPQPEEKIVTVEKPVTQEAMVSLEGILKPYGRVFRRQATHKITDRNNRLYLLKGNTAMLNSLIRLKVKITGRVVSPPNAKNPLIEVVNIEVLN